MTPNVFVVLLVTLLALSAIALLSMRRRLVENDIRLRTIIESEPECVKLQARDGEVLEMNTAGLNLLEARTAAEVIGHTVYEFVCPEHLEAYRELTNDVFEGKKRVLEFQVIGRSGTKRWLETNAAPLRDKHGNTTALLAITRDITQRKHLEKELQQKQLELHHACRVSTIGEVASGIAHELNQPLCVISSFAETCTYLAQTQSYDKLQQKLGFIVAETERANHIVSRVREIATHKWTRPTVVSLMAMFEDVSELTKYYLESNGVTLTVQLPEALPDVHADKIQIEQVLLNLVRNAVEAMAGNDGARQLTIAARNAGDDEIVVSVVDNGPGVRKEHEQRITDPYFSTKDNGMGIGLPMSRSIISAHGGRLWLDKSAPHGACFCFSLPVTRLVDELPARN